MAALDHFWAVVPAGGAGTRLWPVSRSAVPKFLHDLNGDGRSLLQHTVDRLTPLVEDRLLVVTGADHREAVLAELPGVDPEAVVAEPAPRDSMAAIGLAAAMLERADPLAVMGSFAADHVVTDPAAFEEAVALAVAVAREDWLVTLGITPTHAATGFGYIHLGEALPGHPAATTPSRSSRSRRPTSPSSTSTLVPTAGTPACSWPGPGCCLTCWPRVTRTSRSGSARSPPSRSGSTSCG